MASISTRDLEELSAYLDQQLDPRAKARLESRLKAEPELSAALEELRRTRLVLRSQPGLRAPRNFTLTPKMTKMKVRSLPGSGAFPVLRLASALASVLLVLVVAGELITGISRMTPVMAPQPPSADMAMQEEALSVQMTTAVEVMEMPAAVSTESLMQFTPPSALMGSAEATGQPVAKMAVTESIPPGAPAMTATPEVYGAAALLRATAGATMREVPTETLALVEVSPTETPAPTVTETPAEISAPVEESPTINITPLPEIPKETPYTTPITPIRVLEVALLLVAVVTGVAAILLRRSL